MKKTRIHRRRFLKQAAAAVTASLAATGASAQQGGAAPSGQAAGSPQPPADQKLSAYKFESNVWVRINDRVFTCYRSDPTQKYPYFYPVFGPVTGLPMTEETALPWPHHRSLFLGLDRVNGANFWQEGIDRGQIVSRGCSVEHESPERIVLTEICDWRKPGEPPVITDRRTWTITAPSAGERIIEADIQLEAVTDVHVTKTNHSLFAIRVAAELAPTGGGMLVDSAGRVGEQATFGQVAAWCGFQGRRHGQEEAIVLLDHPNNPWSPSRWFTRDYGNISPTPFNWLGDEGWRLPNGQSIRLRYQVLVMSGPIEPDTVNARHKRFAATA
jgi:hypothetical protein